MKHSHRYSRRVGFLLSALIHLSAVAALLPMLEKGVLTEIEKHKVSVSLAMFEPVDETPHQQSIDSTAPAKTPLEENEPEETEQVETAETPEPKNLAPTKAENIQNRTQVSARKPKTKPEIKKPPYTPTKVRKTKKNSPIKKPSPNSTMVASASTASTASGAPLGSNQAVVDIQSANKKKQRYLAKLMKAIHRKKYYPAQARQRRISGQVIVEFEILKNGGLEHIRITDSSGSNLLDEAAAKTLRNISPFQPIPDELNKTRWKLAVPINFDLKR